VGVYGSYRDKSVGKIFAFSLRHFNNTAAVAPVISNNIIEYVLIVSN
jgi:hypothetical protein